MIGGLLNLVSSGVTAFFGFKKEQASAVKDGLKVLSDVNSSNEAREKAVAQVITAEATSGYWLSAIWRPLTSMVLLSLVVAAFFGFEPSVQELSPITREIFELLKICIMGYIPARSVEKIITQLNIGKILGKFVEKKLG